MIVLVDGKEEPYAWGSIDIDDAIGQRSTASYGIVDKVRNKRFKRGQNVEIYDGDVLNLSPTFDNFADANGAGTLEKTDYFYKHNPIYDFAGIKYQLDINMVRGKEITISHEGVTGTEPRVYLSIARADNTTRYIVTNKNSVSATTTIETDAKSVFVIMDNGPGARGEHSYKNVMVNFGSYEPFEPRQIAFGGVISRPVARFASLGGGGLIHGITCADWHYFADKRIIAKAYENTDAGDIVRDIITNYLADEGIQVGNIQAGIEIVQAVFNYIRISDALDSLCEKAGFEWTIDANKFLHFFARSAFVAPVNITETSDIKNVEVEPAAEDYRNKQYIRAGKDVTDPQTVEFKGDGKNKSFIFPYELAKEPVVKVDGVTQTVGIRGLEDGQQWYWNKGDKIISQDDNVTPLSASQTLSVTGQGYFDIIVLSYEPDAIEAQKAIEGGTGIHEDVLDDPYLTSRAAAFESASAKLRRYARIGNRVTFDTKITGLRAGQLINIDLPSFDINETDFLIESIKASELGTHDGRLLYQVSAVDGAASGGWANFFKKMATRGQAFVIRENIQENEILITLGQFSKTWAQTANPNIFNPTLPNNTLYPGATVYPALYGYDRIKYVSFFDAANNEIFRKAVTKLTDNTTGTQLTTTALILPFEANAMDIAYIGFWGGSHATASFGTGVLIDKQPYVKRKTDAEMVQIEKIDLKGW